MRILIVGGVAGGASVAARARRLDARSEIIMFERGHHVSFSNCALPYYLSGTVKNLSLIHIEMCIRDSTGGGQKLGHPH